MGNQERRKDLYAAAKKSPTCERGHDTRDLMGGAIGRKDTPLKSWEKHRRTIQKERKQ